MTLSTFFKSACLLAGLSASLCDANAISVNMTISKDSLQHITGFGAAALGTLMCPLQDTEPIKLAYGEDSPIGFNIMRIEVSPSTTPDVKSQWYDSPYDWHGFVGVVKEARKRGAIIYACPWSPPPVLKTNNSASGGEGESNGNVKATLNELGYKNFFIWLNNFAKYMKGEGAPVDIISLQNEPDWWVGYSGCLYEPTDLVRLVKGAADKFNPNNGADANHPIKLMSAEPLGYRPDYAKALLSDPDSRKYIDYLGGHIYGHPPYKFDNGSDGYMKQSVDIANKYGVKEVWMTEHSVDPVKEKTMPGWDEQITFAKEVNEVILAGGTAYVYWYLTQFWGFIGDGDEGITGDNTKNKILPRGYVASHFAKHLAGSQRLKNVTKLGSATMSEMAALQRNAFTKGDSIIVIAINSSANAIDLNINTPEAVETGKIITSTSNDNLCKESALDFQIGSTAIPTVIPAKSVNTIILRRSNPTGIDEVTENKTKAAVPAVLNGIYTLSGQKLLCDEADLPSGIYIINGKKITK